MAPGIALPATGPALLTLHVQGKVLDSVQVVQQYSSWQV